MKDTRVTFKAKARTGGDGARFVSLVAPEGRHIDGDAMMTVKAVQAAWQSLFGHNGHVSDGDPLVERFDDGFMPTVTVNLGDARTAVRFKRSRFWEIVDGHREAGAGLVEAEDLAHEAMRAAVRATWKTAPAAV